jgi:hypothetical protein
VDFKPFYAVIYSEKIGAVCPSFITKGEALIFYHKAPFALVAKHDRRFRVKCALKNFFDTKVSVWRRVGERTLQNVEQKPHQNNKKYKSDYKSCVHRFLLGMRISLYPKG